MLATRESIRSGEKYWSVCLPGWSGLVGLLTGSMYRHGGRYLTFWVDKRELAKVTLVHPS